MRVLLIDRETQYYAGAERMLEYFAQESAELFQPVLALGTGSRVAERLADRVEVHTVEGGSEFGVWRVFRHALQLARLCRKQHIDVVHAWVARDWEVAVLAGLLARRRAFGTLHDHPQADFIRPHRRRLMRWCATHGLRGIAAVSKAVQDACLQAGYSACRVRVIHNGLVAHRLAPRSCGHGAGPLILGFIGVLSERKGLPLLFELLDQPLMAGFDWRLHIAGEGASAVDRAMRDSLVAAYSRRAWWSRVKWLGWLKDPAGFFPSIDVLLVPSTGFDPFPNVVLESCFAGVPVVSTNCGGMPEMICTGETGWVFTVQDWPAETSRILLDGSANRQRLAAVGRAARSHVEKVFSIKNMVEAYGRFFA